MEDQVLIYHKGFSGNTGLIWRFSPEFSCLVKTWVVRLPNSHYSHTPETASLISFAQEETFMLFGLNSEISFIRYFFLNVFCLSKICLPLDSKFKWKYKLSQITLQGCSPTPFAWDAHRTSGPSSCVPAGSTGYAQLRKPLWIFLPWKSTCFLKAGSILFCLSLDLPFRDVYWKNKAFFESSSVFKGPVAWIYIIMNILLCQHEISAKITFCAIMYMTRISHYFNVGSLASQNDKI